MSDFDVDKATNELAGMINSIRMLNTRINGAAMSGDQILAEVAELFPPARLFSAEIRSTPIIYRNLREWLLEHGATLPTHSSRRIMMQLATNIYMDDEDKIAAESIVKEIIAEGRRVHKNNDAVVPTPEPSTPQGSTQSHEKLVYYIGNRFRNAESKFSGDLGESWTEYVSEYQQVARDYSLTPKQKKQYLHNLLKGDAKRYYLDRVDNEINTFAEAVRMIGEEYNSLVRQNRVKNHLTGLRITKYTDNNLDELEALERVYKTITKLSPQVPASHRSEAHKIEFLRNSVIGQPWATEPLSRIATHELSFQQLYGELEAALHLSREAKLANLRDRVICTTSKPADEDIGQVPGILFQGPGRYANSRKFVGDNRDGTEYPRSGATNAAKRSPLNMMGCFNCDSPNHMLKNCPSKVNLAKAAQRRMEYLAKRNGRGRNANVVLFELCSQLSDTTAEAVNGSQEMELETEREEQPQQDANDTSRDFDLFESLMNHCETSSEPDHVEILLASTNRQSCTALTEPFNGACLDTGAQRSVVGKPQAEAYYQFMGIPLAIQPSTPLTYKFGSEKTVSIGKAKFRIPYAGTKHMFLNLDVVDIDVPLLVGLDVMDEYKLMVDNLDNRLVCKKPFWSAPLTRKRGHLYYVW